MDSAKGVDVFAKMGGKEFAVNIVHVIVDAHCMGNAKMEVVSAKQVSMGSTAPFRLVLQLVSDKVAFVVVMEHAIQSLQVPSD